VLRQLCLGPHRNRQWHYTRLPPVYDTVCLLQRPLICTAKNKHETALGFVDDTMFLTIGNTLIEAHDLIKDMMERPSGGFDWSNSHFSPYELTKLAIMNFPRSLSDAPPADLSLTRHNPDGSNTSQTVKTVGTYKYLGVVVNPKLCWTTHHQKVIANATWWSNQVAHLSKISGGMPPKRVHQLYNTVAVPAFTYAADIWYMGLQPSTSGLKRLGSVSLTKKLTSVQRRVAKTITGSLNTTAGDVLEAHANLLPIDLLFSKVLFRVATRIASLPPHILYTLSHIKQLNTMLRNTDLPFTSFSAPPRSTPLWSSKYSPSDNTPATGRHSPPTSPRTSQKPSKQLTYTTIHVSQYTVTVLDPMMV